VIWGFQIESSLVIFAQVAVEYLLIDSLSEDFSGELHLNLGNSLGKNLRCLPKRFSSNLYQERSADYRGLTPARRKGFRCSLSKL